MLITNTPNTVLVYNKQNMCSVLAAAMVHGQIAEEQSTAILDVTQLVPDDAQRYIWIGVDPRESFKEFYRKISGKNNTIINDPGPAKPLPFQFNPFKTRFPKEEPVEEGMEDVASTLIHKAGKAFGFDEELYMKLNFHASRFYGMDAEIEHLAYVYKNLLNAETAIHRKTRFVPKEVLQEDVERYMHDTRLVASTYTNSSLKVKVLDGERVKEAVQTTFSDFRVHLALRISRAAHSNFLNLSMGLSGVIAYSNMRHLIFDKQYGEPVVLN